MIPYVLHVAVLISVCLLFYKIFLQRETFYRLNRLILLFCMVLAFAIPLITIPQAWTLRNTLEPVTMKAPEQGQQIDYAKVNLPVVQQPAQPAQPVQSVQKDIAAKPQPAAPKQTAVKSEEPSSFNWSDFLPTAIKWLFYLYWAGVAVFGLNLLIQVIALLYRSYSNPVIRDGKFRIIEVSGDKAPCSFGNNIFINPEKYDWDTYNQILLHEKVHIEQGHSLDIILAELVIVFQWFNPFAWLYRGELENNLEFLTDEAVLDRNVEKESYQMSLLKVSAPHLALSVTTNYNQSLLKKRIVMMNAKKSNIHTMWKYFILLPLMAGLACALNQTVAYSQSAKAKTIAKDKAPMHHKMHMATEGTWFATIKGEKVRMEFRSDDDDHNWSNNDSFLLTEFSSIPKDTKAEFTVKRDAGTVLFNGKFDGDQGYGHYKFTADKSFVEYLKNEGIRDMDDTDNDEFAFFLINISKSYVGMLKTNGYGNISKNELISMAALKVDEPFIKFWKEEGYAHLDANELVSAKALGLNKAYVHEIHEAGYKDLDFNQLISFKAQGIDAKYIAAFKKTKLNLGDNKDSKAEPDIPRAEDISSFKAMHIDSGYIQQLKNAGYDHVPFNELTSMKAVGVTPEYVKKLADIGYKNIPANELVSMKSVGVNPDYVKSLADIGYKNIPANELVSLKSVGVNPDYVKGMVDIGYKSIPANELVSLKSVGVTPDYVKSLQEIGYKDLSANDLSSAKALGITATYIKSFEGMGFKNPTINQLSSAKSLGINAAFIKSFADIGYTNLSFNELESAKALGINGEYIKSFEDAGYRKLSMNQLSSLKAMHVTPDFIKGFKDIGFPDITPNEATSLKATGVTPEYVKEMKAKGFVSKDVSKYIQLKNAFN